MSDIAAAAGPAATSTAVAADRESEHSRPGRARRPQGQSSRSYWLYLIPGGLLFAGVIIGPLIYNIYLSLTKWSGVGSPRFIGFDNYIRLLGDSVFWISFKNSVAMIIAMVVIPTLVGLVLASVLFDYLGRRFGSSSVSVLRAVFYLPQVLPVVVAGIVWGWILRPDGAFNAFLDAIGLQGFTRDWLGDPNTALPMVMLVMVWVQIGYPVVIFMSALQRVDPEIYEAAEIDGAGWWATVPGHHPAADPARDLRGRTDLHHCRAQGVRPHLRADQGRPGERDECAVLLRLFHVLQEAAGRLRRGDRHRADPHHRAGRGGHHALAGIQRSKGSELR